MSYKVLVFRKVDNDNLSDSFVDENMLGKGIYNTNVPALHTEKMTIEMMVDIRQYVLGLDDLEDEWIQNIRKCQLVNVELVLK
jgi:hypothetical protein